MKRASLVANVCIAVVLIGLGIAVFTADLSGVFLSVGAPVYNGNKERKNVSIMINVYTGTEYIADMMKVMEEEGADATFFLGGSWVKNNMKLTAEIAKKFELGNHGYTHKDMKTMSEDGQSKEIQSTHALVKSVTKTEENQNGTDMKLFAPPSGSFSKKTLKVAESLGYTTIMWSKDTIDWRDQDRDLIFNRATRELKNGDLILMHPTKKTLETLRDIIKSFKEQGFSAVRVSENIK